MNGEKPGEYVVQVYEKAVETAYLSLSRTNLLKMKAMDFSILMTGQPVTMINVSNSQEQ